ncbi:MAG: metal-dependent transcriptional regulator [Acidobacteriota bacterium]
MMDKNIEELLEEIWTMQEEGEVSYSELQKRTKVSPSGEFLQEMARNRLIRWETEKIELTERGEDLAKEIIRRHRLAELLLSTLFEVSEEDVESQACEFEHILSPSVTDSVCTFLSHPSHCPHGKVIPSGQCCSVLKTELEPLVKPLTNLQLGEKGKIVFIAPKHHDRLNKLSALGIIPGSIVKMHQRNPSFVIEIGETTIAIDYPIASSIYVKKI